MRRITVSVLTVLIALPAMADARLPVVNIAAGSVSARAAFGEDTPKTVSVAPAAVAVAEPTKKSDKKRTVVARRPAAPQKSRAAVDAGEQIIAAADVLAPRRPSADLWARSDTPLRMPDPTEFSVLRADYDLPEESLDVAPAPVKNKSDDARATRTAVSRPMAELDGQIAKLVELQRRADESLQQRAPVAPTRIAAAPVAASVANPTRAVSDKKIAASDAQIPARDDNDVKLSRMVVPMTSDVVVRTVEKNESPRIAAVRDDMTKMSPTELRKAFRKTFLSENKHLSAMRIDDRFDVASDMSTDIEGFTAKRDLSEEGGIRPLEIKIRFRDDDSALSRDNYNLLSEYASIVVSNPKRAIQVSIPQNATKNMDERKLAARRLAIVEQVLRDTGVSEQRIMPVLSARDEEGFVLRIISSDQYETLTQRQRNMFGDTVGKKSYKSMSW